MASLQDVSRILSDGALAFPAYDKAKLAPALKHYLKAMSGFDAAVIEAAMDILIQESKFFPSVSEMVATCKKVAADNQPKGRVPAPDLLRKEAHGLERMRTYGHYNPKEWEELARKFEAAGRVEAASHWRLKAGLPFEIAADPVAQRG